MSLFYSNIALMIHVERLITSSLPRHVCIPRHISPILPRTSSPTSKGPYRKSLSFSMSSFGPWLSELFIRFNTPKSPNTPSKTGRLLNGALQKVHCSSNQSQFFFAAVKKFIEACRNNFAILGTCLKKKSHRATSFRYKSIFENPLSWTKQANYSYIRRRRIA
jgi:hypothetical protein